MRLRRDCRDVGGADHCWRLVAVDPNAVVAIALPVDDYANHACRVATASDHVPRVKGDCSRLDEPATLVRQRTQPTFGNARDVRCIARLAQRVDDAASEIADGHHVGELPLPVCHAARHEQDHRGRDAAVQAPRRVASSAARHDCHEVSPRSRRGCPRWMV